MAEKRCKRITCDYVKCNEAVYLEETSSETKCADWDKYVKYEYEAVPEGWEKLFIPGKDYVNLCPAHSNMYMELVSPFLGGIE